MKQLLLPLTLAAFTTLSATAMADVKVYGFVTYNMVSDDTEDDVYFGRHEFAESRFGFKGTHKVGNVTYGAEMEVGLNEGVNSILYNDANGSNSSRLRVNQLTVNFEDVGKFYLGTGQSITWIIGDVDQSGTWLADPLAFGQRFGATRRGPSGQSQTPFVQSNSLFNERIRFDSTKIAGGLTLHAQYGEDNSFEVASKYNANGVRFNVWHADYGDADTAETPQSNIDTNGSAGFFGAESANGAMLGYKHSSGFNISAANVTADQINGTERKLTSVKIGYTKDKHAVSISNGDYSGSGIAADHTRNTLSYVFSPTGGVKLWAQTTQGDTDGEDGFSAFAVGGLIKL